VALALVTVLDLVSGGLATNLLAMSNFGVAGGQFWRLLTAAFTAGGLLGLLMDLLVLWLAGRAVEAELGSARFVALYLVGGLGGATLFFVLGPPGAAALGASAAVIGLLSANAVGKLKNGEDVRPDIGLFVLLLLYSLLVGFESFGWVSLLGGIVVGALAGAVLAYAPRRNRGAVQTAGLVAIVAVCFLAVVARLLLV
jgi:membrane associated rhomboid family serine protease